MKNKIVISNFKETIFIELSDLKETQGDLKSLSKNEYEKFKSQFLENGYTAPFVIWIDNKGTKHILDGHTRKKVLLMMQNDGCTIPSIYPANVIEAKDRKTAVKILMGLVSQYGKASIESLSDFAILEGLDFDWIKLNVDIPNVDLSLEVDKKKEGLCEDDEVSEPAEPIAKLGQIYQLGEHRLMCGDSTDEATVSQLMNGKKADMVFTDPPYGISIVLKDGSVGGTKGKYKPVMNDENTNAAELSFKLCKKMETNLVFWGANHYSNVLPASSCWIVWDKQDGKRVNFADCELAYTNIKKPARLFKHIWDGFRRDSEKGEMRVHPTQKPVKLIEDIFDLFKKESKKTILDLFGGSGSTLIACEKTNRECFMMELDPYYVDVIIARWEKFTGKKAELINE